MWIRGLGWILATGLCITTLFATVIWNENHIPSVTESVAYAAFYKLSWILGITWVTLMCATGYGGFVNSILSWSGFLPLSRLTYLIYILHFVIIFPQVSSLRSTVDTRHQFAIWVFFGHLMGSTLLAFVVKVIFESPLQELDSVFMTHFIKKKIKQLDSMDEKGTKENPSVVLEKRSKTSPISSRL